MSILRTAARVGVASSVHGRVQRRQQQRWSAEQPPAAAPAPPAPTAVPAPAAQDDILGQLAQLGQLRAAGVLTEAEFEQQKARILG